MSFIINPYRYAASGGGTPDPGGVSPSDLSGLQLWLKANAITGLADDAQITTTWPESSGNSRVVTAVASGMTPTYPKFRATDGPNSYPAVRMVSSATGGWFTLPNFLTAYTAGNFFALLKCDVDNPAGGSPPHGDWGTAGDSYYTFSNNIYDDFGTNSRKDAIAHAGKPMNVWHLYEVRTASAAWSNHYNGVQLFSTGTNTVAWSTAAFIGHTSVNSKFLQGLIAEVIFFNRVLTSSEKFDTIHTYLNNKYALGLPTS